MRATLRATLISHIWIISSPDGTEPRSAPIGGCAREAKCRPSRGRQCVAGMPQVMKVQVGEPGCLEGGEPVAAPEVAVMQGPHPMGW